MMNKLTFAFTRHRLEKVNIWIKGHTASIFVFNLTIALLVLLSVAGYFKPFFYLSINAIFFLSFIFMIFFLDARARALFTISLIFLILAAFFKAVRIEVWADRAGIYMFQAMFLAVLLLLLEFKN